MNKEQKESLMEEYEMYSSELSTYKLKARQLNYKPVIPRLPSKKQDIKLLQSTMTGFSKRFDNWKNNLKKFEEYNSVESTNY